MILRRLLVLQGWAFYISVAALTALQPFLRDTVPDEAWFLQVVRRYLEGQVPYRDFFLGVTPLSLYLSAIPARALGVEVLVLRSLQAAVKAAMAILVVQCGTMVGMRPWMARAAGLAYLVLTPPMADSLYTPLANLFLMAALACSLKLILSSHSVAWAAVGLFAGLSFASKQNIGLYAVAAAVLSAFITAYRQDRPASLSLLVCGFLPGALVPLVPVALEGALPKFVEYGFIKVAYLRDAGFGYWDGLSQGIAGLWGAPGGFIQRLWYLPHIGAYLLIPTALVSFVVVVAGYRGDRRGLTVLGLFSGAALMGLYPRAAIPQVVTFVPYALLWLFLLSGRTEKKLPALGRLAEASRILMPAGLALVVTALVLIAFLRLASGQWVWSDLPHYRGTLLPRSRVEVGREVVAGLGPELRDGVVFVAGEWASFYYLAADGRNPTAYDFPLSTAMGLDGERQVIRDIEDGRIRLVAMCDGPARSRLAPRQLLGYVYGRMAYAGSTGPCDLYRPERSTASIH